MKTKCAVFIMFTVLLLSFFVIPIYAGIPAGGENVITIPKAAAAPIIDGIFDPVEWRVAAKITGFVFPTINDWVTQQTIVNIMYSDTALHVFYTCYEDLPGEIVKGSTRRDSKVWRDDSIEIFISTTTKPAEYIHIIVNPIGTVYDTRSGGGETGYKWNSTAVISTKINPSSWTVEMSIPYETIGASSAPKPGTQWKLNFCRNERPQQETSTWARTGPTFHNQAMFGLARFAALDEFPQGYGVTKINDPFYGNNTLTAQLNPGMCCLVTQYNNDNKLVSTKKCVDKQDSAVVGYKIDDFAVTDIYLELQTSDGDTVYRTKYGITQLLSKYSFAVEKAKKIESVYSDTADMYKPVASLISGIKAELQSAEKVLAQSQEPGVDKSKKLLAFINRINLLEQQIMVSIDTLKAHPDAVFGLATASSMDKIFIVDKPSPLKYKNIVELSLAKNETEAVQVAVMTFEKPLRNVTVKPSLPTLPGESVSVALMGYVKTQDPEIYRVDYIGWWPDPIIDFQTSADAQPGETLAFWVEVKTSTSTPVGEHRGVVTVTADGCPKIELPFVVTVWDFALPQYATLPTAFTFSENVLRNLYGTQFNRELEYKYREFMLSHRVNPDQLYRRGLPPRETILHDVKYGLNKFNLFHMAPFTKQQLVENPELKLSPEQKERYKVMIDSYMPFLRENKLLDKAYIYGFDEYEYEAFPAIADAFGYIKSIAPEIQTMTTARDNSFGTETELGSCIDIWCPLTPRYDMAVAEKIRPKGKQVWWYNCITPRYPYANWLIENTAIEARLLLGVKTVKYKADGYLYYSTIKWAANKKPIAFGPYTDWDPRSWNTTNGDGSIIYAGPNGPMTTIRFENIKDGLEDYEYWYLLRKLYDKNKVKLSTEEQAEVEALLAVPDELVESTIKYTFDSAVLYSVRAKVAEAILKLKQK
ncbi:MAG: glycoside hydrolase domain-containing protein [Elusimicrobiota bacterium]